MIRRTDTAVQREVEEPIDEELLAEAKRGLGTAGRNATVNAALREYVMWKREHRRQTLADLRRMSEDGVFNYKALDEADK